MSAIAVDQPPATTSATAREGARAGAAAIAPISLGYLPFALVVGRSIAEHDAGLAGWMGSWLIYGGSAHLAVVRLADSSGAAVAIATALLVNARLLAYSASLSGAWRGHPTWFKLLAATMVIDPTWAVATRDAPRRPRAQRAHFLAMGAVLGIIWSTGVAAGATVAAHVRVDSLAVTAPLCLLAVIAPRLADRADRLPIAIALVVAVAATVSGWPAGVGYVAAAAVAWVIGDLSDRRRR